GSDVRAAREAGAWGRVVDGVRSNDWSRGLGSSVACASRSAPGRRDGPVVHRGLGDHHSRERSGALPARLLSGAPTAGAPLVTQRIVRAPARADATVARRTSRTRRSCGTPVVMDAPGRRRSPSALAVA